MAMCDLTQAEIEQKIQSFDAQQAKDQANVVVQPVNS